MSRRYTHVQELLPEIKAMLSEGRSQREIAEHLGLRDENVVFRSDFEKAITLAPQKPSDLHNDVAGPSYVYAIITYQRIR